MSDVFFAGPGLDRADSLRSDPVRLAALMASPGARALVWNGAAPALDAQGRLRWGPMTADAEALLGTDGEDSYFTSIPAADVPHEARAHGALLADLGVRDAPLFATALSLANWHHRHGFCSACGKATRIDRAGWARHCEACGADHFPRVDPVVIMLAEHDGRLLLGRQPHYAPGRYSALAGFLEPGETIEAAVARELHEEAGIRVVDVRYIASQPWPFPNSLMIGAHAVALDDALTIDFDELDDARWFTRDEVAAALAGTEGAAFDPPPRVAIARCLLEWWIGHA